MKDISEVSEAAGTSRRSFLTTAGIAAAGMSAGTVLPLVGPVRPAFAALDPQYVHVDEEPLRPELFGAIGDGTTIDTRAFAEMAAVANSATGMPSIQLSAKTYRTDAPINIGTRGWALAGHSHTRSRIVNAVSDVFNFGAGAAGSHHYFHDFRASASAGHIFNVTKGSFYQNDLSRLTLDQAGSGFSVFNQPAGDFIDNKMSVLDLVGTRNHTVPLWKVVSASGGANTNTFQRGRSTYSGKYVFWFEETNGSAYTSDNVFDGWNFEIPNGGCIMALSANGWSIQNCAIWDLTVANGGVSTRDFFVISRTTGPPSRFNSIKQAIRHGGALGPGLSDIKLGTASAPLTRIEQCDLSSGSAGFTIDLGRNSAVELYGIGGSVRVNNRGSQTIQTNGASVGLFGKSPVGQAAAISSPPVPSASYRQAEAKAMKASIDAIRVALKNMGITA